MGSVFITPGGEEVHPDAVLQDKTVQPNVDGAVLFGVDAVEEYKEFMLSKRIEPSVVDTIATHELEHARVACLFLPNVRLGIVQVPDRSLYVPFFVDWGAFVPRLIEAAIAMAPPNISEQDVRVIRALGYETPEDVAERVDSWNAVGDTGRSGIQIPRPKGRTNTIQQACS